MIDAKDFMEALDQLEETKGIAKSDILDALKEALIKAYVKDLGGGSDADVRVIIDMDPPSIDMVRVRKIVNDEDIEDDYLEISPEDAKELTKKNKNAKIKDGELIESVPVEELKRYTAISVKNALKQKLAEAEKQVLYTTYKDKIGEMVSGTVEKCDDHGASVVIGRSTAYISRKELIGDEMFLPGSQIRLFVSDVSSNEKGPMIRLSRSDAGFLKRLFEEQVREIYDGSVIIKNIAREAGVRSKISVYTNDPNIDPIGACIGVNGKSIQNILASLGDKNQEKVDIVLYSVNPALYIIDALRPATVLSIAIDKENKQAIAIVENDKLRLAVGRRGSNARLAAKLTEYKIDVKEEDNIAEYQEMGYIFKTVEEVKAEEEVRVKQEIYNSYLAKVKAQHEQEVEDTSPANLSSGGIEKMKPQNILDEDIKEEEKPAPKAEQPKVEEVKVEEAPAVEAAPVRKEVKTTTTLEDLEQSLESEKKREAFKATQKTSKRPKTITEKEVAHEEVEEEKKITPKMDIYTEEELREFENEEEFIEDDYEDDIDYDEYEEFYDDDDK